MSLRKVRRNGFMGKDYSLGCVREEGFGRTRLKSSARRFSGLTKLWDIIDNLVE